MKSRNLYSTIPCQATISANGNEEHTEVVKLSKTSAAFQTQKVLKVGEPIEIRIKEAGPYPNMQIKAEVVEVSTREGRNWVNTKVI